MPQFYPAHTCDSFVTLAQLCSPPAVLFDQDITTQERLDHMGVDQASPLAPTFHGSPLDLNFDQWKPEPQATCSPGSWPVGNAMGMSMRLPVSEYSGSSPSDSPSPPGTSSVHQEQHQKRRAQNRAAQRAYRDRKLRYLLDLEQGIREIEQKMMQLQSENTGLIRELCETRAENNDLRGSRHPPRASLSTNARREQNSASRTGLAHSFQPRSKVSPSLLEKDSSGNESANSGIESAKKEELESLYEPFAAMWNLIQLDPSVVKGNISAQNILDRLRGMVEAGEVVLDPSTLRSLSSSEAADVPLPISGPASGGD